MKKIAITLALLAVSMSFMFGQTASDSITMKKVFGGYQFYQGERLLKMNDLTITMVLNNEAYKQIKSARSAYTMASILSYAGGFLVGWPLGTAIGGGEPNWTLAGIGAGLIVVSIPITQSFNKKAKQAVDTYNGGLQTSSFWDKNELNLSLTGNGIGLTLNF
ncbi:MAG: hypothetical protein RB289_03650 [Paludibacter sp.]|jgi:hypothetical protein|nr:hypothetical protein [Paludibacter sp.]